MELTIQVAPHERTVRFKEVRALACGDLCSLVLEGVREALPSLRLGLYSDAGMGTLVASCVEFSAVPGHAALRSGSLDLNTAEMCKWFDAEKARLDAADAEALAAGRRPPARDPSAPVPAFGWLLIFDDARTWASCRVPVLLRPLDPSVFGVVPLGPRQGPKGDRGPAALVTRMFDPEEGRWHGVSLARNRLDQLTVRVDQDSVSSSDDWTFDADVSARDGSVPRSISDRFSEVFDVKDYGAFGDGHSDDFGAVSAAMAAARESGGGCVFFPPGRYVLASGSVMVPSCVHVRGSGPSSVIVQPNFFKIISDYENADGSLDLAAVRRNAVDWTCFTLPCGTHDVTISDLRLEGPCFRADGDYANHPVVHRPYSVGILARGRDYRDRMALAAVTATAEVTSESNGDVSVVAGDPNMPDRTVDRSKYADKPPEALCVAVANAAALAAADEAAATQFTNEWNRVIREEEVGPETRLVRVERVDVEGFGDGIQLDNVTDAWVVGCSVRRCGRAGVYVIGGLRCAVDGNVVEFIEPGDTLNRRPVKKGGADVIIGGNRSYGVSFTKVYRFGRHNLPSLDDKGDLRQSSYCGARRNFIRHTFGWKALDTHGGTHIDFVGNFVRDCHIGIGIDKAVNKNNIDVPGATAAPAYIKIVGNTIVRESPDFPWEGDGNGEPYDASADVNHVGYNPDNPCGCCGAGIFVAADDRRGVHRGHHIVVTGNVVDGFGEITRFGAVYYGNWRNVVHADNVIRNSRRAALCLHDYVSGSFTGDMIDDVRRVGVLTTNSSGGVNVVEVQKGIYENGTINPVTKRPEGHDDCAISGTTFVNRQATDLTAVSGPSPASGAPGLRVALDSCSFSALGGGSIVRGDRNAVADGYRRSFRVASGYVSFKGPPSNGWTGSADDLAEYFAHDSYQLMSGIGIASVERLAVGSVLVTLAVPSYLSPSSVNILQPSVFQVGEPTHPGSVVTPGTPVKRFMPVVASIRTAYSPGQTYKNYQGDDVPCQGYAFLVRLYGFPIAGAGQSDNEPLDPSAVDGSFYISVIGS